MAWRPWNRVWLKLTPHILLSPSEEKGVTASKNSNLNGVFLSNLLFLSLSKGAFGRVEIKEWNILEASYW